MRIKNIVFCFLFCALLAGCSQLKKGTETVQKTSEHERKSSYSDFVSKYSGSYNGLPFNLQVRVKPDSVIWGSVSSFSIEAARFMLTNDSVFFMDKINRRAYRESKRHVCELTSTELNNAQLESLFLDTASAEMSFKLPFSPAMEVRMQKRNDAGQAQQIRIEAQQGSSVHKVTINRSEIKYNQGLTYPFNVPSSYTGF